MQTALTEIESRSCVEIVSCAMPTKRCCCGTVNCQLGFDNFNRADSATPGPKWHVLSGTGAIVDNHIEVSGAGAKVATTICHPSAYVLGSLIATFKLVDVRSIGLFEVGVGDPQNSNWRVQFVPSGMDTFGAKITVRVFGSAGWEESEVPWPTSVLGTSADTIDAQVCYEPKGLLRGGIGIIPRVDTCIELGGWEAACYSLGGGVTVGNFFFTAGNFDDFAFETTILDNFNCPVCGCFCFKREGTTKDWNCYPSVICLTLELTTGTCTGGIDGLTIPLYQGFASPTYYPEKIRWFSEVQTCSGGASYTFIAECSQIVRDGTNWFQALSLRMADSSYLPSTVVFNWLVPEPNNAKLPAFGVSTCDPLYLVYPGLKVNSFIGPCGPPAPPGTMGYYPFCCPITECYPTPPDIQFNAIITEC